MIDLSVNLFGKKLKNPLFLPSGIVTDIASHKNAIEAGLGLIVLKSITLSSRQGNPLPRVVKFAGGFLNSVGLINPGLELGKRQIEEFIKQSPLPVVVSIFATSVREFKIMAEVLVAINPFALELNLSCPNLKHESEVIISHEGKSSYQVVKEVKKVVGKLPVIAKLSPNIGKIGEIARWCQEGGADAISAINTVAPAMIIDIEKKRPILGAKFGGMSGPAIKPIAIAKIYEIYQTVQIPILGMGGVSDWRDVIEMILAGACLVGVGSVVYLQGWGVYQKILTGLTEYLKKEKINSLKEIVGLAHKN